MFLMYSREKGTEVIVLSLKLVFHYHISADQKSKCFVYIFWQDFQIVKRMGLTPIAYVYAHYKNENHGISAVFCLNIKQGCHSTGEMAKSNSKQGEQGIR